MTRSVAAGCRQLADLKARDLPGSVSRARPNSDVDVVIAATKMRAGLRWLPGGSGALDGGPSVVRR